MSVSRSQEDNKEEASMKSSRLLYFMDFYLFFTKIVCCN